MFNYLNTSTLVSLNADGSVHRLLGSVVIFNIGSAKTQAEFRFGYIHFGLCETFKEMIIRFTCQSCMGNEPITYGRSVSGYSVNFNFQKYFA